MITTETRTKSVMDLPNDKSEGSRTRPENEDAAPTAKRRKISSIVIKPSDYVRAAFKANGCNIDTIREESSDNFIAPTEEMLELYKAETLDFVRKGELSKLKELHEMGKLVNCCNKFGESLLHLAARRSKTSIVKLLVEDVKIEVNIRDDYRRTPLHDACWTSEPNFEVVDLLIRAAPHHLVLEDVRGFTPFDYVRRDHWGKWLRFLWERKSMLRAQQNKEGSEKETAKL